MYKPHGTIWTRWIREQLITFAIQTPGSDCYITPVEIGLPLFLNGCLCTVVVLALRHRSLCVGRGPKLSESVIVNQDYHQAPDCACTGNLNIFPAENVHYKYGVKDFQ